MFQKWMSQLIAAFQHRVDNPLIARLMALWKSSEPGQFTKNETKAAPDHDLSSTPIGGLVSLNHTTVDGNLTFHDVAGRDIINIYTDDGQVEQLTRLIEEQQLSDVDYDSWRVEQNQRLNYYFRSEAESRAHLGQILNITEEGVYLIERAAIWQKLDAWFQGWKDTHSLITMLGEEGDGKTWASAAWVQRSVAQQAQFPAVIFLPSTEIQSNEPLDILAHALAQNSPTTHTELAKRSIERWLKSATSDIPLVLLVLDGINERYTNGWWRALLEKLNTHPWANTVAVLITCRGEYWERYFGDLQFIKATTCLLEPYNDQELDTALTMHNLRRSDIPAALLWLARKPRYFDLLIRHRERIAQSGDITFARLIYEDWRDRLQRKRNIGLDDNAFQNLLRDLASKHRAGQKSIRDRELANLLLPSDSQVVEELRTSGVFREHNGKYEVQEHHLALAFALLLVDEVEEAVRAGRDIDETIAEWLEPHPAMDIKGRICEMAALHAFQLPELPTFARVALLLAWMTSQNVGERAGTTIAAYFPKDPQSYFELAEVVWSGGTNHRWGQRILMQTFQRWIIQQQDTHIVIWRQWCERWLSFVHRFGYPSQREKGDQKPAAVQQAITERLGFELPADTFSVAGYQFTTIDDDGLLRLGRVALALISHVPRAPYIHALATGCLAEAIMDYSSKYDEFAWVIRTSQQPIWNEVRAEVEQLLNAHNRIAQQAAYRLLLFVGNVEAFQLQKAFPDDLFRPNPFAEIHKRDPCISGLSWRRQDCERCISRTDIDPGRLARQIKPYCIDPHLPVPEDMGARLAPLAETIDIQSMHIVLAYTSADHAYERYEPALCAYAPESLADVVRRLVRHIVEREDMPLRQLSIYLKNHSLIFTQTEQSAIYQAWSRIQRAGDISNETVEVAEMFLFPEVLKQLNAQRQIAHLLSRPEEAHDRIIFEMYFQPITVWKDVWQQLATAANVETIIRILWFLSANAMTIAQQDAEAHVLPLITHDQSRVRAMVLQLIFLAKATTSLEAIIRGPWVWQPAYTDEENRWGSLILCEYGSELPFSDMARRVHPLYLGYAVSRRGCKPEEVTMYAEMLHRQWLSLGIDAPDLPADFPLIYLESFAVDDDVTHIHRRGLADNDPSQAVTSFSMGASWGGELGTDLSVFQDMMDGNFEQRQRESFERVNEIIQQQVAAGNQWFAHDFFPDALDCVLHLRPDLVDQWVANALSDQPEAHRRLQVGSTFFEALCEMLLQTDPERGLKLYWHFQTVPMYVFTQDSNSKIRWLDYALFCAPGTADTQQAWDRRLEQCKTDQELLEVVLVAQAGQGQDWLWSYIDRALQSGMPLAHMRAITVLGFIDDEASAKRLIELETQLPDTWVRKLVRTSLERQQRDAWAKHWFCRFLTADDDTHSWAAFRLFLRCADRRFWLWRLQVMAGVQSLSGHRRLFLEANMDTIENQAKKNEEAIAKQFLGQKVQGGQLWPWM